MTSPLRRKRLITPRNTGRNSTRALAAATAIIFTLLTGQFTHSGRAFASDTLNWGDTSINHENKLRWLPYRPEHKDTDSKTAEDKCAPSKHTDCKSAACEDSPCKRADFQSSGSTVHSVQVHRAAGEASASGSKVRLASVDDDNAPVLNDPFEDNRLPAGYQHPIAITPEDVEPAPAREAAPWRPQRVSQQVPAEPRELPGHSVKAYQSTSPSPGSEPYQPAPAEALPDMEGSTRQALQNPAEDCRSAYDKLRGNTLDKVSLDITVTGKPGDDIPYECALTTDPFQPRCWQMTCYTWKASCLCHKPLYFEEEALERYGHSHGWICEDLVSCAHFFGNVALLPYHVGVETPCECIYDLGVYRPGDCAPYICDPFPISLRGCCTAAVGYGAVVALFP